MNNGSKGNNTVYGGLAIEKVNLRHLGSILVKNNSLKVMIVRYTYLINREGPRKPVTLANAT